MWSLLELIRPLNCLMAVAGVLIGGMLVTPDLTMPVLLAAAAAFLITGAGNSVNDLFDIEPDKINRPGRPIPSGRISKTQAAIITVALFAAGILLSSAINWLCFFLALLNSGVLVLYSYSFQDKMLLGNVSVSYLVASTFIFGGAAANNLLLPFILAILAFLATFSREVVKDLQDLEGDRRSFMKRIASRVKESFADRFRVSRGGIKLRYKTVYAVLLASFSLWMAVVISLLPYLWEIFGLFYLFVLVPADAVFILASFILIRRRKYGTVSRLIKIGMALGLLAFVAGVFL